jgi:hypothetical protein
MSPPICPLCRHLFLIKLLPKEEISNDGGVQLVDRLEKLQSKRTEIEDEIEQSKEKLRAHSETEGTDRISRSAKVGKY